MLSSALKLRLQQLEANVTRILQLLKEYEGELVDENDPGIRSKYRRRIEDLNRQRASYEEEFTELQTQLRDEQTLQMQTIAIQLHQIDNKLNWLLDSQSTLHQAILAHFPPSEHALLRLVTEQLNESQIIEIKAVLEAVDTSQIPGEEIQRIIIETKKALMLLGKQNPTLTSGKKSVLEILNQPTIDAKHALKISIPIIPFILSYEGELGLGAGINLKETWERWKIKFLNR